MAKRLVGYFAGEKKRITVRLMVGDNCLAEFTDKYNESFMTLIRAEAGEAEYLVDKLFNSKKRLYFNEYE